MTSPVRDDVLHQSDPPYVTIKPNYRPQKPFHDQIAVKQRFSFNQFGEPRDACKSQNIKTTCNRNTM